MKWLVLPTLRFKGVVHDRLYAEDPRRFYQIQPRVFPFTNLPFGFSIISGGKVRTHEEGTLGCSCPS
jgi:hypothetical protein